MNELYKKLLAVQKEVGAISKDLTNPFFKAKYFDVNSLLDELKPVLNKHNVLVMQPLSMLDGKAAITTLVVDGDTGEKMDTTMTIPESLDPQKMGSAITYFRRYALQSLFLLQAEDDDGNVAADKTDVPHPTTQSMSGRAASDKQKDFILKLQGERGVKLSTAVELDKLNIATAKALIEKLMATPVSNAKANAQQDAEFDVPVEYQ